MNRKYIKILAVVLLLIMITAAVYSCTPPIDNSVVVDVTKQPQTSPEGADTITASPDATEPETKPTTEPATEPATEPTTEPTTGEPSTESQTTTATPDVPPETKTEPTTPEKTMSQLTDILPFVTTDLYGKEYDETLLFDANLTMMNVWATWCQPCIAELPDIQSISAVSSFTAKGLAVYGVLYDSQEEGKADEALAILNNAGITYPVLRNSPTLDSSIIKTYDITAFPTTLFIDNGGNVISVVTGSHSFNEWVVIINELFAEM